MGLVIRADFMEEHEEKKKGNTLMEKTGKIVLFWTWPTKWLFKGIFGTKCIQKLKQSKDFSCLSDVSLMERVQ